MSQATNFSEEECTTELVAEVRNLIKTKLINLRGNELSKLCPSELRRDVLNSFGVLSPFSENLEVTKKIRRELNIAVNEYITENKLGFAKYSVNSKREGKPLATLIDRIKNELGLTQCFIVRAINSGRSGASVYWVQFSKGSGAELGVLKILQKEEDLLTEYDAHLDLQESWMREYIPHNPQRDIKNLSLLINSVGRKPDTSPDKLELDYLIKYGDPRIFKKILKHISKSYYREYDRQRRSSNHKGLPHFEVWNKIMESWPAAYKEGAWSSPYYWHECGLPSYSEKYLMVDNQLYWNPVYLVNHSTLLKDDSISYVCFIQHGDLNTGNILFGDDECAKFIDFEKSCENSGLFDLCWLSLWILQSRRTPPSSTSCHFGSLIDAFYDVTSGSDITENMFDYDHVLSLCKLLFKPFLSGSNDIERLSFSQQFNVTMAAAALGMAFYEVRSVKKLIDSISDEDVWVRTKSHRMWSVLYLGLASKFLSNHTRVPPNGSGINLDHLWNDELNTNKVN